MEIHVVAKNSCTTVGESPHWEESTQSLIYVDIRSGDVHRWSALTKTDTKIHIDGHIGFAVPCQSGHYIIGLGPTLCLVNWAEEKIIDQFVSVDAFRFNDGKCDPFGRLWTGTLGNEPHQRALYSLETDHKTLTCRVDDVQMPNGIAWDTETNTMYFVDTAPRIIYAFRYDCTGHLSDKRTLIDFKDIGDETVVGKPDGVCLDACGDLWVACFGGGCVIQINTKTRKELRRVRIPGAKQITSCCFGGENYADLFVTSAKSRLTEEEERLQPLAGSLYKVTGLQVKGVKPFVFQG
ncbi:hypothetical protein CAPTEDRAFT_229314 [Capitella teleta]|uniref:Regucalcin n=1 Tax=Capitella teleta TaxID=283909 RepID=R7VIS9_CAPTE|nr:hypothetical protein CAPTEDRAFT_229314 [Capitella teleta]|eukprot:ELU18738.1 hypothetical protein CAPTEDRAFT_229314 [Capitella teleta]